MQRQHTGTAGRIETAQAGVFLGYAGQHGRALVDRALVDRALVDRALVDWALVDWALVDWALYVPVGWGRRAAPRGAHPGDVELVTKPTQGLAMSGEPLGPTLERARAAGVPFAWVAGDSVSATAHTGRTAPSGGGPGGTGAATCWPSPRVSGSGSAR